MTQRTAREAPAADELVRSLGGHPADRLGIDLSAGDAELWPWLVAACLLSDRLDEARVAGALAALRRQGAADAPGVAGTPLARICAALADAGHPHPERRGPQLQRAARALAERHAGSLARLAAAAADLEELGGSLAGLGPGLGAATVRRFLEPLRGRFAAADGLGLAPAAAAAAAHLGWLAGPEDAETGWDALRRASSAGTDPVDLEAALARLGARACLRERPDRCPLGPRCPLR